MNTNFRCIAHNSYGIFVRTYRLNIKLDEKPLEAIDQLVPGGSPSSLAKPPMDSNPPNFHPSSQVVKLITKLITAVKQ